MGSAPELHCGNCLGAWFFGLRIYGSIFAGTSTCDDMGCGIVHTRKRASNFKHKGSYRNEESRETLTGAFAIPYEASWSHIHDSVDPPLLLTRIYSLAEPTQDKGVMWTVLPIGERLAYAALEHVCSYRLPICPSQQPQPKVPPSLQVPVAGMETAADVRCWDYDRCESVHPQRSRSRQKQAARVNIPANLIRSGRKAGKHHPQRSQSQQTLPTTVVLWYDLYNK